MKKIVLSIIAIILFSGVSAQGIEFFKGTFEQAKAKAAKENKHIFVDVYTTWCGPCKQMSNTVFNQKAVGDYFNANFIPMKLDAENESKHDFFNHFKASSFPSYFWISASGELFDNNGGSMSADKFIELAKKSINSRLEQKTNALKTRWENGERSLELVNDYVLGALNKTEPTKVRQYFIEYLSSLSKDELNSEATFKMCTGFIRNFNIDEKDIINTTFINGIDEQLKREDKFNIEINSLSSILYRTFVRMPIAEVNQGKGSKDSERNFEKKVMKIKNLPIRDAECYSECATMEKELHTGSKAKAIEHMVKLLDKYGETVPTLYGNFLYSIVISKYYTTENRPIIEKVLEIATTNMKINPSKTALAHYAAANYAAGNFNEAYSAMAWMPFYSGPQISNAVYKEMNIGNIRGKFPTIAETTK